MRLLTEMEIVDGRRLGLAKAGACGQHSVRLLMSPPGSLDLSPVQGFDLDAFVFTVCGTSAVDM